MTKEHQQEENSGKYIQQLAIVTKALEENGIDIEQAEAARTLYQSNIQAKERAGKRKGYENVQYLLNPEPRKAIIQLINEELDFWKSWIVQQKHYKASGYDKNLRPTIHRLDSKGHYEIGNIAMLPMGKHLQERAKPVAIMVVDNGNLSFKTAPTQTAAQKELNVSPTKLKKMKSQPYGLGIENEAGKLIDTGKQIFAIPSYEVTRAEFLQMEIERLKQNKVEYEAEGVNMEWVNDKVASLNEQINNPIAMKAEQDKRDRESYVHLIATIARQEALPADEVDTMFLEAMHRDKLLYERFGWDKL